MKDKFKIINKIWNSINFVFEWLLISLISFMVFITSIQVFYRYVFNNPLTWTSELSRFIFIWVSFLGAWYVFKNGGHLGLDIIIINLPSSIQKITAKIVEIVLFIFLTALLWCSPNILIMTYSQTSPALNISMFYVYLALPLSAFLMLIEIVLGWISPARESVGKKNIPNNDPSCEFDISEVKSDKSG